MGIIESEATTLEITEPSDEERERIKLLLQKKEEMERKFCEHLLSTAFVDPTESAIYAGVESEMALVVAKDLLSRPSVQEIIQNNNPNANVTPMYLLLHYKRIMEAGAPINLKYIDETNEKGVKLSLHAADSTMKLLGYEGINIETNTKLVEKIEKITQKALEKHKAKY